MRRDGYIDPERLYTTEGVHQAVGLSVKALDEGRQAGALRPHNSQNRYWYEGKQIIAWLKMCSKPNRRREWNEATCVNGD